MILKSPQIEICGDDNIMRYGFKDVVIDSRTGLNPRKNFVLGSGKNNYITIKDIYNGQINITDKTDKVDDDAIQIIKKRSRIKVGDILFVSIGRIGETAIVTAKDDTWDVNESVFVFTINSEIITPEYFCILFQSDAVQKYLTGNSSGSTFKSIKMNQLEKMVFDLPSLEVQEDITAKLSKAKAICNLRLSELAQLDDLIKARFVEMFGDMLINPKGLPEQRLDSMADIVSGITKGRKTKTDDLYEVPYMAVSNVKDGYIDWTTVKTIMATAGEIEQYRLKPGDVLMTEGGDPDKLGRGAIIHEPPKDCIHQNHVFRVRLNQNVLLSVFMAQYLQQQKAKRYFLGCAKQTTGIASINMKQLSALPVLVPPMKEQKEYAAFAAEVDKSKFAVQKALDEAQTLFDSLMQQYFG